MPKMRLYCSMSQIFLTFNTPHDGLFLVFGVPNAKYLAFGILDGNVNIKIIYTNIKITLKN